MEITTTMVRFLFPKCDMVKRTDKAQLLRCKGEQGKTKVWLPLSKIEVKDNALDANLSEITMAKWLFLKTELPMFVKYDEFIVKSEITQQQLTESSSNNKFNN